MDRIPLSRGLTIWILLSSLASGLSPGALGDPGDAALRGSLSPRRPQACVTEDLECNSTVNGELTADDCPLGDGAFYDQWQFAGDVETAVTIDLASGDFDTFLSLLDPSGEVVAADNDGGPGANSRITSVLDSTGTWSIKATNLVPKELGEYTLTLACEGVEAAVSQLIVPGFEVEVANPEGPTTFFAVRNTTDDDVEVDVAYHGEQIGAPLRTDAFMLGPQQTLTRDVRGNLDDLHVSDGFATGLIVITGTGSGTGGSASVLEGDYFRIDSGNDFATGDRLVRPREYCVRQEIRFVDFGNGSRLKILLEAPQGPEAPSFSYTAYSEAGVVIAEDEFFTSDHLTAIDVEDLVPGQRFGTLVFDFANAGGGLVTAAYSAFGRFSVELNGACTTAPVR